MVRWIDLTDKQQEVFGNGCGLSWFPERITNFLFGWFFDTSCRRHDFGYLRGGNGDDRYAVDVGFFKSMLADVSKNHIINKPLLFLMAYLYFCLVRLFGWTAFNYGECLTKQELLELDGRRNK